MDTRALTWAEVRERARPASVFEDRVARQAGTAEWECLKDDWVGRFLA